jgi:hypothetical protein
LNGNPGIGHILNLRGDGLLEFRQRR